MPPPPSSFPSSPSLSLSPDVAACQLGLPLRCASRGWDRGNPRSMGCDGRQQRRRGGGHGLPPLPPAAGAPARVHPAALSLSRACGEHPSGESTWTISRPYTASRCASWDGSVHGGRSLCIPILHTMPHALSYLSSSQTSSTMFMKMDQ